MTTIDTAMPDQNLRLILENKALNDSINRLVEENKNLQLHGVKESRIIYCVDSLPTYLGVNEIDRLENLLEIYNSKGILLYSGKQSPSIVSL